MPSYTIKKMGNFIKVVRMKKGKAKYKKPPRCCDNCKYNSDCLHQNKQGWTKNCPFFLNSDYMEIDLEDEEKNKLKNNMIRSKNMIQEIALCNEWDYFITLTLDKEKTISDRYDLDNYKKKLSKWLNHYSRTGYKVKYLLIPEMHKDGAWHMHGLIKGINPKEIIKFTELHSKELQNYYNWTAYNKKFGFCSLGKIENPARVATYISKYITKNIQNCQNMGVELGKHLYYTSTGLNRAQKIISEVNIPDEQVQNFKFYNANEFCDIAILQAENFEIKLDNEKGYIIKCKNSD